jgi:hypothetical protein
MAKENLHPLAVWDRVRSEGMEREQMLRGLAAHHVVELTHILDALQGEYDKTVEMVIAGEFCKEPVDGGVMQLRMAMEKVGVYSQTDITQNRIGIPPSSMHYSHWNGNKLRVLVMDCIKPDMDGRLKGYIPSTLCLNTIAKGWTNGPRTGRLAARDEPLINAKLHEPSLLALVLEQLEGESMCNAVLVNKEWSRVVLTSPEIKRKVDELKEVQILRNIGLDCRSSDGGDDTDQGYSYSDDQRFDRLHQYDGYGSN